MGEPCVASPTPGRIWRARQGLPIAVFVLFYSAVPAIESDFVRILFQRQLAVPPVLLLGPNVEEHARGGYLQPLVKAGESALREYERVGREREWEAGGERGMWDGQ